MDSPGDKLLFAGPVGAGKTTAIACLSDAPPVTTDVEATDDTRALKETTTVAMDYGFMALEDGQYVHLYGSPGQARFDFMWDILVQGCIGVVLLIDAGRDSAMEDLRFYLDRFHEAIKKTGAVIGLTRTDHASDADLFHSVQGELSAREMNFPVMEVDARDQEQVKLLVYALLAFIEAGG